MNPNDLAAVWRKALKAGREGRLGKALRYRAMPYVLGAKYLVHDPSRSRVRIHAPDYVSPDPEDRPLAERIRRAFVAMKAAQAKAPEAARPSSLWQAIFDEVYADLLSGDPDRFHFFLANFGTWKTYNGIENSPLLHEKGRSHLGRLYLRNEVFLHQLRVWRWFHGGSKPLSTLSYPRHGNQAGAFIDDVFVGIGSFFSEIHGSLMADILKTAARPVLADLGAGYGKHAYFALRGFPASCFIDFDLPETLCLAAYFLIKSFPGRTSLLYGEEEYGPASHQRYDLIFMPSFEIEKAGADTVDLWINACSLGEMTRASAAFYLGAMTKAARFILHMNHARTPNVYGDGSRGLLAHEYPIPDDRFALLFRYPDLSHLLYQGFLDWDSDIFIHLYGRKPEGRRS